jgi:large subunit ribosomal protein L23
MNSIIIKPLITEKSMAYVPKGKYSFVVAMDATKPAIKSAIKAMFNVTVVSIVTSVQKGKTHRVGTRRVEVDKPEVKKTMVTVKKGETIGIFESGGVEEKNDKKEKKEIKENKKSGDSSDK